jgi:hypothetical protein
MVNMAILLSSVKSKISKNKMTAQREAKKILNSMPHSVGTKEKLSKIVTNIDKAGIVIVWERLKACFQSLAKLKLNCVAS